MKTTRMKMFHRPWALGLLASLATAWGAEATLIIDLPDLTLQPNQASQTFVIQLENTGDPINLTGAQLEFIVGDGDAAIGGSGGAPAIAGVSLISSGLLFSANTTGDRGSGNFASMFPPDGLDQLFQRMTSTSSGVVSLGAGAFDLSAVTFDTTGIASGVYSWSASASPNGASFLTDDSSSPMLAPTLVGGTLTIAAVGVPDKANTAILLLPVLVGLGCFQFATRLRHSR